MEKAYNKKAGGNYSLSATYKFKIRSFVHFALLLKFSFKFDLLSHISFFPVLIFVCTAENVCRAGKNSDSFSSNYDRFHLLLWHLLESERTICMCRSAAEICHVVLREKTSERRNEKKTMKKEENVKKL